MEAKVSKDSSPKNETTISTERSQQKVVLVTGATSGFGFSTSKLLADHGYRVFGTSRHPGKLGDGTRNFKLLELDVGSDKSVSSCVAEVLHQTDGKIEVLINNAGYASVGALEEISMEEARIQLDTNLFGVMRMVNSVLPVMRRQKSGRIINLGSIVGHIPIPFAGLYSTSKFALEGYTEQLRLETKNLGIIVSLIEPGYFRTNLVNSAKPSAQTIEDYREIRARANAVLEEREEKGEDPIIVAKTVLKIIESDNPSLHHPVGKDKNALLFKRILPQSTFEGQIRRIFRLDGR